MALTEAEELELLELEEQESMGSQATPKQMEGQSFGEALSGSLSRIAGQPKEIAQNMTPEKMSQHLPLAGMAFGGAFGGPVGMAAGAGLGQIGARMADLGYGRVQPSEAMSPVREAIAPMAQTALAGIPETSMVSKIGRGLAKAGETLTGVKKDVFQQAAKQGYSTYAAPSIPKAQNIFSEALGPEGRAAMKQSVDDVFDPAVGQARGIAKEIGNKIENGEAVSAVEALKARQATDRVISATPVTDKKKLGALYEWRSKFDDVMTSQSGELANASTKYRQAIVKSKLLSPTRLTKSGQPSAFLPLVLGAGGRGVNGLIAGMTGTSPMVWGLGATTVGAVNPIARRALISELISRVTTKNDGQ